MFFFFFNFKTLNQKIRFHVLNVQKQMAVLDPDPTNQKSAN